MSFNRGLALVGAREDARAIAALNETLGCAAPEALQGRLDDVSIATIRRCVVELRQLAAESAGVDERRLALSGAFLARLQPPGASARRRALESKPRCYWRRSSATPRAPRR